MINQFLHREPVAVDREQHRQLKVTLPVTDWSVASRLNAIFVALVEFRDACREFPIVFIRTNADGEPAQVAPVAVLGVLQQQNLYLEGGQWKATYLPAVLQTYPFCVGRLDADRFAICLDRSWPGLSVDVGAPLFTEAGEPSEVLKSAQEQLERLETEVQRTRLGCDALLRLDILRDMRFDATLPDGRSIGVDGFLIVDEERLAALSDEQVLDLHRRGLLGLIHAHLTSVGHMQKLVAWHVKREAANGVTAANGAA